MTVNKTLKRIAFVLLIIGLAAMPLTAETVVKGIEWQSPTLQAQGNSAGGLSGGWDALFTNPALYAAEDGEFTLLSVDVGGVVDPYKLYEDLNAGQQITNALLNQVVSNGIGARTQFGVGWVGDGFGIASANTLVFDAPKAETVLGATVNLDVDSAFIFGYSHKIELGDELSLAVGGDLQALAKVRVANLSLQDVMTAVGSSDVVSYLLTQFDDIQAGWAIGGNVGTTVEWRFLRGSLAIRDIGHTRYQMYRTSLDKLQNSNLGTKLNGSFIVPMTMRVGFGIDPGWDLFNPKFHVEYIQPLATEAQSVAAGYGSFLTRLNAGAELELLNMLSLRGGLRGGYLTAGVGLDLFVFEVNAAVWAEETGFYLGDAPQMAGNLEIAFRY